MRHLYLLPFVLILFRSAPTSAQCTTTNATSCQCPLGQGTNCDLLPDMTTSWYAALNYLSGPNEEPGRIYITSSTPNIGYGPLEVRGVDLNGYRRFVCGIDTFVVYDPSASQQFACPNGGTAKQLTTQRIFHKNGNAMTSTEHVMPQGMTYHPTHGHTHYDQWGIFSLRMQETGVSDPRQWPIVGQGYKLGFCLMDYHSCNASAANHHCKDNNTVYNAGTTLTGPNFPNLGLGGSYGCSMVRQGISSGYTDVYSEYLDGMWVDIPTGTCNGAYWIVMEADPLNVVVETDETNNWTAVPYTLTQQPSSGPVAKIFCDEQAYVCAGEQVELRATPGTAYQWSNGATSSSIVVGPGTYSVSVTGYCGTAASAPFTVTALPQPTAPAAEAVVVCEGEQATLTANGNELLWFDMLGNPLGSGATYTTPPLYASTSYQVADQVTTQGTVIYGGKQNNSGSGGYHAGGQSLRFNALASFTLASVKVYAGNAGYRTVELVDVVGVLRATRSVMVPAGESRIDLDWDILPGNNYLINVSGTTDLWRSTGSVSFPYPIGSVASITGSSGGATVYPYFYDWEVEVGGGSCQSAMTSVTVTVEVCSGVDEPLALRGFEVFPNPSNGQFNLTLHLLDPSAIEVELFDMMGRRAHVERLQAPAGQVVRELDMAHLSSGVYMLSLRIAGRVFTRRIAID
ncbi:MAG: T9SS type A sorting domain-containing protein [Flavobacteriales bacterium]|nr:T9SS type A sorting domain-containing protein [Flavobacteriales bacterium]